MCADTAAATIGGMLTTSRNLPVTFAETAASTAAVLLTLAVAWHGFTVHFCLGSCPGPTSGEILVHRLLAAALGLAVVTALVVAARRGASWAMIWHVGMALVALFTAALFAVPTIDWQDLRTPDPVPTGPSYEPCYSGSNDCVGG